MGWAAGFCAAPWLPAMRWGSSAANIGACAWPTGCRGSKASVRCIRWQNLKVSSTHESNLGQNWGQCRAEASQRWPFAATCFVAQALVYTECWCRRAE